MFSASQPASWQTSHRADSIIQLPNKLPPQFRVENKRARPKIVKNVQDQGNLFFSQQANNSAQLRRREFKGSNGNIQVFEVTMTKLGGGNQDPANFTFFKERLNQENKNSKENLVSVANLINQEKALNPVNTQTKHLLESRFKITDKNGNNVKLYDFMQQRRLSMEPRDSMSGIDPSPNLTLENVDERPTSKRHFRVRSRETSWEKLNC